MNARIRCSDLPRAAIALSAAALALLAARGANAEPTAADFCADPYAAICGPQDTLGKLYDQRFAATKQKLYDEVGQKLAAQYGYTPADDSGYDLYAKAHPEQASQMLLDFQAGMRQAGMDEVGPHPLDWQLDIEKRLQPSLRAAVSAQAQLTAEDKTAFSGDLDALEVVDAAAMIAAAGGGASGAVAQF